jgi:hypothetical protein
LDRRPGERSRGGAGLRFSSGLALLACLLCVGLAVGGLILAALNGRTMGEILVEENTLAIAVLTVAFSAVGALIASHRPGNSIGWIFCAVGLFQGLANFGYEYATHALIMRPGSLPLGAFMSWVGNWTWAPGLGLVLVFLPLLFPNGRPPSRRWWLAGWVGGASIAAITVLAAVFLWPERGPALLRPPTGEEQGPQWVLDVIVEYVAFPLMLAAGLAAVASLPVRFRRARGASGSRSSGSPTPPPSRSSGRSSSRVSPTRIRSSNSSPTRLWCSSCPRSPSPRASPSSATASTT